MKVWWGLLWVTHKFFLHVVTNCTVHYRFETGEGGVGGRRGEEGGGGGRGQMQRTELLWWHQSPYCCQMHLQNITKIWKNNKKYFFPIQTAMKMQVWPKHAESFPHLYVEIKFNGTWSNKVVFKHTLWRDLKSISKQST